MRMIISRRPETFWWFQPGRFSLAGAVHAETSFQVRTLWQAQPAASSSVASHPAPPSQTRLSGPVLPRGPFGGDLIAWARNQLTGGPVLEASHANLGSRTRLRWPCHLKRHARHRPFQPDAFTRAAVCLGPRRHVDCAVLPSFRRSRVIAGFELDPSHASSNVLLVADPIVVARGHPSLQRFLRAAELKVEAAENLATLGFRSLTLTR